MGNPNTTNGHRFGIQGPQDNPDPHIARQAALREAAEFGMIGLLNRRPAAIRTRRRPPGVATTRSATTPMSARGNMWGDAIGDSFGRGGLGLSGIGEGGGGRGEGIGASAPSVTAPASARRRASARAGGSARVTGSPRRARAGLPRCGSAPR